MMYKANRFVVGCEDRACLSASELGFDEIEQLVQYSGMTRSLEARLGDRLQEGETKKWNNNKMQY